MVASDGNPARGEAGAEVAVATGLLLVFMLLVAAGGLVARFGVVEGPILLAAVLLVAVLLTLSAVILVRGALELVGVLIAGAVSVRSHLGHLK